MASKDFGKHSFEWEMFANYWKLCKRFWIPEDDDKYWDEVVKETEIFMEKYQSEILSKYIGLALIETLEKKHKNKISEK